MTFQTLLSESPSTARQREGETFEKLAGDAADKIVLVGAGKLGRKVLTGLRRHGVQPLVFADRSVALQQVCVEGLEVLAPHVAATRYAKDAVFVVTNFRGFGDEGMASRITALQDLGCDRVTTFLPLAWRYPAGILPHYGAALPSEILGATEELRKINDSWADDTSRKIFVGQLLWRLWGDFTGLGSPTSGQYLPCELFQLSQDDRVIDGGAYDGDTLHAIGKNFHKAWAFEPDRDAAARLRTTQDARIEVIEAALGDVEAKVAFCADGTIASAISPDGEVTVQMVTLDRRLGGEHPTFVKLDIEGSEQAALNGGRQLLSRTNPIVCVCAYHRPEDIWTIPSFLRKCLPAHRLFVRAHQNDGFELVVYAVPEERLILGASGSSHSV